VVSKERSRKREFLEVAFGQAIRRTTFDEMKKLRKTPMGRIVQIAEYFINDWGGEVERPMELFAGARACPETVLLDLDDRKIRHQLLRKACRAVADRQELWAVILHHGHGVPVTSKLRGKPSLTRIFRKDARRIKYRLSTALTQMRAALGITS
jgi:hypothetical protein